MPAAQTKEQIEAELAAAEDAAVNVLSLELFQHAMTRLPGRPAAQVVAMIQTLANLMGNCVNLDQEAVTGMIEDCAQQVETRVRNIVTIRSNLEMAAAKKATKQ